MPYTQSTKSLRLPPGVQPQYPVEVDRSHPLGRHVIQWTMPGANNLGSHAPTVNEVGPLFPPKGALMDSGENTLSFPGEFAANEPSMATVIVRFERTSTTLDDYAKLFSIGTFGYRIERGGTGSNFGDFAGGSGVGSFPGLFATSGEGVDQQIGPIVVAISWDSSNVRVEASTGFSSSVSHNVTTSAHSRIAYGNTAGTLGTDASNLQAYVSLGVFAAGYSASTEELKDLVADPYQIFKPAVDFPVFWNDSPSTQRSTYYNYAYRRTPGVQPQYPVILDWDHPLLQKHGKDLVVCYMGDRDYLNNKRVLTENDSTVGPPKAAGRGVYWDWDAHNPWTSGGSSDINELTVFFDAISYNWDQADFQNVIDMSPANHSLRTTPTASMELQIVNTSFPLTEGSTPDQQIPHFYIGGGDANGNYLWSDSGTSFTTSPNALQAWDTVRIAAGSSSTATAGVDTWMGLLLVFTKNVGYKLIEELNLHRDPYQIFKPAVDFPVFWNDSPSTQKSTYYNYAYRRTPGVQPQYPVEIDWSNPITRGIDACMVFNAHGGPFFDLAANAFGTPSGTGLPFTASFSHLGQGVRGGVTGTNERQLVLNYLGTDYFDGLTGCTFFTIMRPIVGTVNGANIAGQWENIQGVSTGNQYKRFYCGLNITTSDNIWCEATDGTTSPSLSVTSPTNFRDGNFHSLAFRFIGDTELSIFFDGESIGAQTATTISALQTNGSNTVVPEFFGGHATDRESDFDANLSFFASRALSDAEIASLHIDPYQIFKPAVDFPVFFGSAALPLSLSRISAMHFQRHYEPITMGE